MTTQQTKAATRLIKLIFRGLIPLAMLGAGVVLMTSRISGWSLIIGIPVTVIGMAMLVFTYDEVVQKQVQPIQKELVRCNICGRLTARQLGVIPEDVICRHCRERIREKLDKK